MMQINQFRITFNHENIMDDFDIYESVNVNYKSYAKYFNQLKDEVKEALSIIYLHGKVYILTKKGMGLKNSELDIKKIMISRLGESKEFIIFKLLVYAKTTIKEKETIFDSDGLFYIVKASKRVYETVLVNIKKGREDEIYFSLNAKNFIKKSDNEKYSEKRDKYKDDKGILVRLKKGETPKNYFVKQKEFDGYKRSSVDFLQTDWTKRKATKIYTLIRFLKDIRRNLKNYLSVELEELEFKNFELKRTSAKRNSEITDLIKTKISFEKYGLIIEDFVKDNKSKKFIDSVSKIIEEEYNSIVSFKKMKSSKSQFNLFITESIGSKNDPYQDIKKLNKLTQNILLENLENPKTVLPVLLKELVIKQDIISRKISIPNYQNADNMTFYYFNKDKESKKYSVYKMILDRDNISFNEVEYRQSLFDEDEKGYIDKMLFEISKSGSEAELIIKNSKGDVNIITKTNYFSIPNIEHIAKEYELLSKPFNKSYNELVEVKDDVPMDRKKEYIDFLENIENRDEINLKVEVKNKKVKNYLADKFNENLDKNLNRSRKKNTVLDILTGIKYSKINDKEAYYVVGTKEIASSFARSNIIRKIEAIEGKLLLDEVLVMMDEYFVRNKELTVLPYPLKYLREFVKIETIKE
jgi:hypothetical protein